MTKTDAHLEDRQLNLALTQGPLSYIESPKPFNRNLDRKNLSDLVWVLVPTWDVIRIQPKPLELLLKTKSGRKLESTTIRTILTELQQRTQRSFVALYNPTRQYVLISVRG